MMTMQKPLVLPSPGRIDMIPDWLQDRVRMERINQVLYKKTGLATDAEVCCYLIVASHKAALDDTYPNILLYLRESELGKAGSKIDVGAPDSLNENEQGCLRELKDYLWDLTERAYEMRKTRKPHPSLDRAQ